MLVDKVDSSDDEEENYDEVIQFSQSQPSQSLLLGVKKRLNKTSNSLFNAESMFSSN